MSVKSSSVAFLLSLVVVAGCNGGKIVSDTQTATAPATTPPTTPAPGANTISPVTSSSTAPTTSASTAPTGPVSVAFAPSGQAHDLQNAIKAELDKATKTIDIAAFLFTSDDLADAVIAAKKRGVAVRALFDGGNASQVGLSRDQKLSAAGIDAKAISTPGTAGGIKFHHKFCVIDGEVTITGSYNWTVDADENNYENLVILRDKTVSAAYAKEFDSLFTTGKGGVGSSGDIVFSPTGAKGIQSKIAGELAKAKVEVVIACYLMTSTDLTNAVVDALKRGVKVSCLFDARQAQSYADKVAALQSAGASIKMVTLGGSGAYARDFHHKFAVIDGQTTITGSFNWTVNQDKDGYENVIVLRDLKLSQQFITTFSDIWSSPVAH